MNARKLWLIGVVLVIVARLMKNGMLITGCAVLALALVIGVVWCFWLRPSLSPYERMVLALVEDYQPELVRQIVAEMDAETREEFSESTELLYLTLARGNMKGAELLLELGMDINAYLPPSSSETTVLQTFCMEDEVNLAAIRFLLEHGANPDAGLSFPPLMSAQARGHDDLVQLLLQHGANPDTMNPQINPGRNTPLHSVCAQRKVDILARVKALLESGADVNALTTAGHTPLDMALEQKGDMDKNLDEFNGPMPLLREVIDLLKEHGALRGCQLRCPKPRFCGRVLIDGSLPDANQLRYLCKGEPGARVVPVNHAWQGEGLGALVDDAAMDDEQKRAALAHTCYIEIALEEPGTVPLELGRRYVKLLSQVAQVAGCVGVDFGRTVLEPAYAQKLVDNLQMAPYILVQGKPHAEGLVTEGMEDLGFPEVIYADTQDDSAVQVLIEYVLPMLLEYGACLGHNHRAFISPDFSLVAKVEPLGPGGSPVLTLHPDHTNYRD